MAPVGFALARGRDPKSDEVASTLPASIEDVIADIWEELLKVPQVGEDENFFALGGDSLMAIQCVSRLRDKIAVRLTLTDFFENGTVAEQAALIRERHAAATRLSDQSPSDNEWADRAKVVVSNRGCARNSVARSLPALSA